MPIEGYNFAPVMFLLELSTQCDFARVSFDRLQSAAPAWYTDATPEQFAEAIPPREIMIQCTTFLSAAGVISKTLFAGSRTGKVECRCKRLRQLVGINDLPTLRNLSVRNSFEHIDERLDQIFSSFASGRVEPLSVTERPPPPGTLVLKRFDPKRLTVSFATAEISVTECMSEISEIESRINPAFKKLQGLKFDLWTP